MNNKYFFKNMTLCMMLFCIQAIFVSDEKSNKTNKKEDILPPLKMLPFPAEKMLYLPKKKVQYHRLSDYIYDNHWSKGGTGSTFRRFFIVGGFLFFHLRTGHRDAAFDNVHENDMTFRKWNQRYPYTLYKVAAESVRYDKEAYLENKKHIPETRLRIDSFPHRSLDKFVDYYYVNNPLSKETSKYLIPSGFEDLLDKSMQDPDVIRFLIKYQSKCPSEMENEILPLRLRLLKEITTSKDLGYDRRTKKQVNDDTMLAYKLAYSV